MYFVSKVHLETTSVIPAYLNMGYAVCLFTFQRYSRNRKKSFPNIEIYFKEILH